ncbi:PilY2 family type 4a fimbrial biogenesis protein [Pseudomonas citronellolis]|uniref:PilY2 family type 4a fimbrial biogenesis protein n=2 Tax=Pseudomonas citronellolis TaxID=53408 RepID=UPI0008537B90|nr:PilY2 family type 4a fimbrial biogenesis protein [Pseudomonas humi]
MMKSRTKYITLFIGAFLPCLAQAEAFEDNGTVENVILATNHIIVDGKSYLLPNNVPESNTPTAGPAILQLQPGMFVVFSGHTGAIDTIDSLAIHLRQPTDTTEPKAEDE